MRAMVLEQPGQPLVLRDLPERAPGPGQVLIDVAACGVCRTDLHVLDGDLPEPKLPLILGHEIVGRVVKLGDGVRSFQPGDRVGVPWLGSTCGHCSFCRRDQENLCEVAGFTGYQIDGGFAETTVADARYCFPIPDRFDDVHAAPLLCAGLIGYRSYRMALAHDTTATRLGIYGFGAAAHILCQVAVSQGREVFAFTRPDDRRAQEFATGLGAAWAGSSEDDPGTLLDAAILFAPVGALVPIALRCVRPGGIVVCGGIHMSEIPAFPYELLWRERVVRSVANLTRQDGTEFLAAAADVPVCTHVEPYPLERANDAVADLRRGTLTGAAVLVM